MLGKLLAGSLRGVQSLPKPSPARIPTSGSTVSNRRRSLYCRSVTDYQLRAYPRTAGDCPPFARAPSPRWSEQNGDCPLCTAVLG
jgi:hypothetical protein